MMKKIKKTLFIVILIFVLNYCNIVKALEFDITSKGVILYNLNDNEILYELNKDERMAVASLTKIMTTVVAIENIENLDEEVIITEDAIKGTYGYSKAGLKIGDVVTYRDLLYGIMLPSGADAVNTIVLNTTGDLEKFVFLMNEKAQELDLTNTHFDNAIGKDSVAEEVAVLNADTDSISNYSTPQDIAILLKYALNNNIFREIFTTKSYTIKSNNLTLTSTLNTYSKLSSLDISNIKGAKSGFTDKAGLCLASIATIDNVDYLLVTLGADVNNRANAIKDSITIYDYYSNNYSYQQLIKAEQIIVSIPIKWGKIKEYNVKAPKNMEFFLKNDFDSTEVKYNYEGINELTYKIKKGTKLGTVEVLYADKLLTNFDVYLDEQVEYYHPVIYSVIIILILNFIFIIINLKRKKNKK